MHNGMHDSPMASLPSLCVQEGVMCQLAGYMCTGGSRREERREEIRKERAERREQRGVEREEERRKVRR